MQRRSFLQTMGSVALGTVAAIGTAAARETGSAPTDDVRATSVSIFASKSDPTAVPPGSWIDHRWGWLDTEGSDSTRADVERYISAADLSVAIDGQPVTDPAQYWQPIQQRENGTYVGYWSYVTPPKARGVHTFDVSISFPDGYQDDPARDTDDSFVIPAGREQSFTGYYDVTPAATHGANRNRH